MQGFRYALAKPQGHQKGQKLRPRWFLKRTGGGDGPESALEGIEDAINYLDTNGRSDATKQVILITDANYHYVNAP